jgi:hypothetical protein
LDTAGGAVVRACGRDIVMVKNVETVSVYKINGIRRESGVSGGRRVVEDEYGENLV